MNLLILGLGDYGKLVKELARNQFTIIDYLDDNSLNAIGVLGDYLNLKDKYKNAVVAIGNNEVRAKWLEKLEMVGYNIPSIISDRAYVAPSAVIEPGCIIEPMAVIHANAKVEKGSIISAGAVINHNAIVHKYCHIDCNAVVGANVTVPCSMNLNYGQVMARVDKPKNWEFSE